MPNYPYTFQLPPLNVQDIPNDGVAGEFLGINGSGVLDWLPVAGGGGGGDMLKADNLSGLADYAIARTNIGLGLTSSPEFANLTLTSPSLASSAPVTISQTWNAVGQTFKALVVNAAGTSGTNSASGSLLADFQTGGTSQFKVDKNGYISGVANITGFGTNQLFVNNPLAVSGIFSIGSTASTDFIAELSVQNKIVCNAGTQFGWGSQALSGGNGSALRGSMDTILVRDGAANTLALRNGALAQTFNVYGTSSSNNTVYERMFMRYSGTDLAFQIGTETTGATLRPLDFVIGGTRRLMIGTTGNVGIGTNGAPVSTLELRKDAAINGPMMVIRSNVRVAGNWASISFGDDTQASAYRKGALIYESTSSSANGKFHIALNNDGTTADATLSDARLTVLPSGNVGIGTTAPGSTLTVAGTFHFGSNNGALPGGTSYGGHIGTSQDFALRGTSTVSTNYYIQNGSSGNKNATIRLLGSAAGADHGALNLNVFESSPITFTTGFTNEQMRITATGNVGIGTTSPTSKLDVAGAVTAAGYYTATSGGVSLVANGLWQQGTGHLTLASGAILGWSGQANVNIDQPGDTRLLREEAYHLATRNGTNGQKFSVYGTYPNATAWERFTITAPTSGNVLLGTYIGTGGVARGMEFQTNGVTRITIGATGTTTLEGNNNSISGFRFFGLGSSALLIDSGAGGFNRLCLGGTTASFPALKRVGAEFQIVKADTTAASNVAADDADLTFIEDRYRRKGAGSPEGVVTAPTGAVYHNTSGGSTTTFYVKESSPTPNTGWVGK